MMKNAKPILITGSHRSGTTWVGKMIATSPEIIYIHEPFNVSRYRPGILHKQFKHWFTYIHAGNEDQYYKPLQKTISLHYNPIGALQYYKHTKKPYKKLVKEFLNYQKAFLQSKRVLIKDPIAFFSVEWLAKRYNMQVVILIRHPAAFAASLKQKNWRFDFNNFLNQPELMDQRLGHFRLEIEKYSQNSPDIIDQACLLWRIIYSMVAGYQLTKTDWKFIRHEDLSRSPIDEFRNLFNSLGLEFTEHSSRVIAEYSLAANRGQINEMKRNSLANIYTWHTRLSAEEISRIKTTVEDVSHNFYTNDDWHFPKEIDL